MNLVRPDPIELRHVGLNEDGFKPTMALRLVATRCTVERGHTHFHSWDEHAQLYFEGGCGHGDRHRAFLAQASMDRVEQAGTRL